MELRPGNHEKAWNDPPMFAYQSGNGGPPSSDSSGSNAPTTKRTLLNKRVAFPLMGNSSAAPTGCLTASAGPPLLPPLPATGPPTNILPTNPPVVEAPNTNKETIESVTPKAAEEAAADQTFVVATINSTLDTLKDLEKREEFRKRLQVMYTMWDEGKLNADIQIRLTKLCQHIEAKEFTAADNLQISLAVDYTTECSPWILAVKNLLIYLNQ